MVRRCGGCDIKMSFSIFTIRIVLRTAARASGGLMVTGTGVQSTVIVDGSGRASTRSVRTKNANEKNHQKFHDFHTFHDFRGSGRIFCDTYGAGIYLSHRPKKFTTIKASCEGTPDEILGVFMCCKSFSSQNSNHRLCLRTPARAGMPPSTFSTWDLFIWVPPPRSSPQVYEAH